VLSWKHGWLALGPGDYAVLSYQYQIGDGGEYSCYPDVMVDTMDMQFRAALLNTKPTDSSWVKKAQLEFIARMMDSAGLDIDLVMLWDYAYIKRYYEPVRLPPTFVGRTLILLIVL
jgi:hypothetical protein